MVTLADGGTMSAAAADGTTFELVVPSEAVAEDTEIRMTPLSDIGGIGDGAVHAVQLEPEGLVFFELVRLTITPATSIPVADQLMFEATGEGADAGIALIDPSSEPIVLLLEHFSIGGVASVTPQQRATFLEKSASNAAERISREVAARIGAERRSQLLGASEGGTPDISDLVAEFQREVVEKRGQAAALSCTAVMTYVRTVLNFERALQLLGATEDVEAASQQRIADAVIAMEARYQECEKEAIAKCQEAEDPKILIRFWLAMERPPDRERAEQLCEPKGLQFEFSGTGTGFDVGQPVPIEWQYWALLCEGSEEWKIWEIFDGVQGSSATGPPSDNTSVPYLVTFGENGSMTSVYWELLGASIPTTASGNTFALSPGDAPTTVTARLNAGAGVDMLTVTAPVEPADGTIAGCED